MTIKEAMQALEKAGKEQYRKIYARHGVQGEMFGVSTADLTKLAKKIKMDGSLAEELWRSGNHDARILASMIADAASLTAARLKAMATDVGDKVQSGALSTLAARSPHARQVAEAWIASDDEFVGSAGWNVVAQLAQKDETLPDGWYADLLGIIERRIHKAKNRTKASMNNALIAIGARNPKLQGPAIAAARRIGKLTVDHGDTDCKTPDAEAYILKAVARKKGKA
jgi:3-methyladenine DNA glycosylase AlkD